MDSEWDAGMVSKTIFYGALVLGALSLPVLLKNRRAKKAEKAKQALEPAAQQVRDKALFNSTQGKKVFGGIRVLELSTHVAAPSAARCLADFGAEVIKIEMPSGDLLRRLLVDFEKPRTTGTVFDTQNVSKFSMQLDLKTQQGVSALKELLAGADVLITNTRNESLKKIGLDYESLKSNFPRLIYAQVSAWGLKGDDAGLPGYDIGAFWTATGLAPACNDPGKYSIYPGGLGDQTTGQFLLAGIQTALFDRLKTGKGQKVEASLLHAGSFIIAPSILEGKRDKDGVPPDYLAKPAPKVVDNIYETKGKKYASLCFSGGFNQERQAEQELGQLLGLEGDLSHEKVWDKVKDIEMIELKKLVSTSKHLRIKEYHHMVDNWERIRKNFESPQYHPAIGPVDAAPKGYDDVPFLPRIPFELSKFENHGPWIGAPAKGEHTTDILEHGWISTPLKWPEASSNKSDPVGPLNGIVVLEFLDFEDRHDTAVSGAAKMLLDMGAKVYKILEGGRQDPLESVDKTVYRHFNHGKITATESELGKLVGEAHLILTDLSDDKLEKHGVHYAEMEKRGVSVVQLVGNLSPGVQTGFTALEDGYLTSGLANILGGYPAHRIPRLPEHCLEGITCSFIVSGATAALFHWRRTGEAQHVKVSYERVGLWASQLNSVFILRNYSMLNFAIADRASDKRNSPLITYSSHISKDGMWVQLLGLDNARHVPRVLKTFPYMRLKLYPAVLFTILFKVIPNLRRAKSLVEKLQPLFICINDAVADEFAKYTYDELREMFKHHDVWYSPIRMPAQLLDYHQTWANDIFVTRDDGSIKVTMPILFKQ